MLPLVPWTLPSRVQPVLAGSMHLLEGGKGSAASCEREVVISLFAQLIWVAAESMLYAVFTCVVDRKGAWESLERSQHTD